MTATVLADRAGEGAAAAYARFSTLRFLLTTIAATSDNTTAAHRATLYSLLLRAALHPALLPFLTDPLRQIAGEFISLDGQIAPLVAGAVAEFGTYPLFGLTTEQQAAIAPFLPTTADKLPAIVPQTTIGGVWGTLYVPAQEQAVACRVQAVYSASGAGDPLDGWPDPIPVAPVSSAVRASARRALRAAASFLTYHGLFPVTFVPAPVYFDVSSPSLETAILAGTDGNSFDLALTLAFLSALSGTPVSSTIGATGALWETSFRQGLRLGAVGWGDEKAAAFRRTCPDDAVFLVPPDSAISKPGIVVVSDLTSAVKITLPSLTIGPTEAIPAPPTGEQNANLSFVGTFLPTVGILPEDITEARDRLLADTLRQSGGTVFRRGSEDATAPEFFAAFSEPEQAVRAALAACRALLCSGWPAEVRLQELLPAFSVHEGPTEDREESAVWHGEAVEQAARMAEAGTAGRVIVSSAIRTALTRTTAYPSFRFAVLGTHRLRDLRPPVTLFEVCPWGETVVFSTPALSATLTTTAHNLPVQSLPFLGRDEERTILRRLLLDPATHLLTVTGAAGSGKSRLALEAAAASVEGFEAGVFLVSLSNAETAEEAAAAIVTALHLTPPPGTRTAVEAVFRELSHRSRGMRLLLLLDGVRGSASPGTAALVHDLRTVAPNVVCLVTARSPLFSPSGQQAGEIVFSVPPLTATAAVALLRARVRQVRSGKAVPLSPAFEEAGAVIGRRFAASPFALMVIASSADETASWAEIAASFVGDKAQSHETLPAHEATRRAVETAMRLLPVSARDLLLRLSCFSGGWTDAACAAVARDPLSAGQILTLLEERGLIVREAGIGANEGLSRRFSLPLSLHEELSFQIAGSNEEKSLREAHARYFELLAVQVDRVVETRRETLVLDALDAEIDNLRAAFAVLEATDTTRAVFFVYHLADFLHYRNHLREWREWPRLALRLSETRRLSLPEAVRSHLHWCCASACFESDDLEEGEIYLDDALSLAVRAGESEIVRADALSLCGAYRARAERLEEAEEAYGRALMLYREKHEIQGEVLSLNGLGILAMKRSQFNEARERYQSVARLCLRIDDRRGRAIALNNMGYIAAMQEDYEDAIKQFAAYHTLCRDLRDAPGTARAVLNLSQARDDAGQTEKATVGFALTEALLTALHEPETSSMWQEMREMRERVVQRGEAEPFELLRRGLASHSLSSLLQMDPADPFASPLRHLRLETVPLTV